MIVIRNGEVYFDTLGTKQSYVGVPYVTNTEPAMAYLKTGYYHVHGAAFIRPDKADPVLLTSSAAAWSETGAAEEIIAAGGITKDFDLHWASIWDISIALYGVIDFFSGAPGALVKIGSVDVGRTANFSRESAMPLQIQQQPANTRISARFVDNTTSARTCRVKVYGHVYDTSV